MHLFYKNITSNMEYFSRRTQSAGIIVWWFDTENFWRNIMLVIRRSYFYVFHPLIYGRMAYIPKKYFLRQQEDSYQ